MITINGERFIVMENLGYNHDIGACAKVVSTPSGEKIAVHIGGRWRFWESTDKIRMPRNIQPQPQNAGSAGG